MQAGIVTLKYESFSKPSNCRHLAEADVSLQHFSVGTYRPAQKVTVHSLVLFFGLTFCAHMLKL